MGKWRKRRNHLLSNSLRRIEYFGKPIPQWPTWYPSVANQRTRLLSMHNEWIHITSLLLLPSGEYWGNFLHRQWTTWYQFLANQRASCFPNPMCDAAPGFSLGANRPPVTAPLKMRRKLLNKSFLFVCVLVVCSSLPYILINYQTLVKGECMTATITPLRRYL